MYNNGSSSVLIPLKLFLDLTRMTLGVYTSVLEKIKRFSAQEEC